MSLSKQIITRERKYMAVGKEKKLQKKYCFMAANLNLLGCLKAGVFSEGLFLETPFFEKIRLYRMPTYNARI